MKFKGSTIHLSHADLEEAVDYWMDNRVLGYPYKGDQIVKLKITRGNYCIISFVDKPAKMNSSAEPPPSAPTAM